jgi:MGT family glycosyltransferase
VSASVAFVGFPALGHTLPSLPLVRAMVRRGAAVDYMTSPELGRLVESAGARFVPYPAEGIAGLTRPGDVAAYLTQVTTAAAGLVPWLMPMLRDRALAVVDASALWGWVAARSLGLPCATSVTTFALAPALLRMLRAPDLPPLEGAAAAALAELNTRYAAGLDEPADLLVTRGDLKLVHTSRQLQPAGRYLDASHVFVGPLADERPELGPRVEPSGERPLAYVSLGTIFNRDVDLLRRCARALEAAGFEVVVSLGNAAATVPDGWPAGTRVYPFVAQDHLLARAALFVTHGGLNSVSEALARGVPMIVIPHEVDQHLVARRVAGLGAAVVVERADATEEGLSAAAARIATDRSAFEAAARQIARSFEEATPMESAADQVLALASIGAPAR